MLAWLALPGALAAERFDGRDFYFGDLHVHTAVSGDGVSSDIGQALGRGCAPGTCGAAAALADDARAAGLDFMAVADHINGGYSAEAQPFEDLFRQMMEADDPDGGFVTVPAAEVHFVTPEEKELGHKNLYLFADNEVLADFTLDDARFNGASNVTHCEPGFSWLRKLSERFGPLLVIPHHPAPVKPMPVDWGCFDEALQPAVEIYSKHGNSLEVDPLYDPSGKEYVAEGVVHYAMDAVASAAPLGFLAATDNHETQPGAVCLHEGENYGGGLAAVVLAAGEPFDRAAIYDAIVERRTYATSGPMLPAVVDYYADGGWAGTMGDTIGWSDPWVRAVVRVPEEVAHAVLGVDLITPEGPEAFTPAGEGAWVHETRAPADWFYPQLRIDGVAWYGEGRCDDGGSDDEERIWLSPTRARPRSGDYGSLAGAGCGCAGGVGGAGGPLAGLAAAVLLLWRRR